MTQIDAVEAYPKCRKFRWFGMFEECIRCCEAPAVDDLGYCGHCHWAVRAEIEEGFYQLREYLRSWARFSDWCQARGHAAA
jgi:hypothetical protein